MDADNSAIDPLASGPSRPASRRNWWIHLILLSAYPVALGLLSRIGDDSTQSGALLPGDLTQLFIVIAAELAIFAVVFGLAWVASRCRAEQLLLPWRDGWRPIWRGLGYSIVLRLAVGVVLTLVALAIVLASGGTPESLEKLRPKAEAVIDTVALRANPVYFFLTLTLVSFVLAGFREELWRAGMIAGFGALFPKQFESKAGRLGAVGFVAVLFGLGHLPQGIGGTLATACLGFGLGVVMIRHGSIWDAVFAHGFFNAASFAMVYWMADKFPTSLPAP